MKVALTGASGFLGQHLLARLKRSGCQVRVLLRPGSAALSEEGERYPVGLHDPAALLDVLRGAEAVIHLAACNWRESRHWSTLVRVNQLGTRNLLQAAQRAGVRSFLHCSSAGIHGLPQRLPLQEEDEVRPVSLLHRSLALGEQETRGHFPGMRVVVARPTGVYGPGNTNLLRLFQDIRAERFLMIGSGGQQTHLSYVEDVVDGLLACLYHGQHQRVYFLGSPSALPLGQWVQIIADLLGVSPQPRWRLPLGPARQLYRALARLSWWSGFESSWLHRLDLFVRERECSLERARSELGFVPRWSARQGLECTLGWLQESGAPGEYT